MHDLLAKVFVIARGAWRYRWFVHAVAWPLCLIGWAVVYTLPNVYQASASVYVDTQSMLRPLLQGLAVQTNLNEQVQLMTRTLLSRPNLEKVARAADMDLNAKTPAELEELLDSLSRQIEVRGARENLYTLTYANPDPALAKKVVEFLLTLFVESSLGGRRTDTDIAQRFIDEQIREYEARLFAAEERLKEFKQKNVGLMPAEGRGYYERLQDAMAVLEEAKLRYNEAENRRSELQRQMSGEEPTFGIMGSGSVRQMVTTAYDSRIQGLQAKLDELLLKYTDEHPDVVALRRTLEDLEKQRHVEHGKAQKPAQQDVPSLAANPVYQQMKIALASAEAEVAALKVRVDEYQARVIQLKSLVGTVPEVEAELGRLDRDYAINKQNYEALLARRETAKISQEAEQSSENVKFNVVDPPRVTPTPVSPHRPLLATVVLLAGLAIGAGFAVFLAQIRPTFDNRRTVLEVLEVPVLGGVSMVWTDSERKLRRLRNLMFYFALLALVSAYVGYLLFQTLQTGTAP
jgi:polysaccharide chain length determinant protein (PEP-CTERM system associated)